MRPIKQLQQATYFKCIERQDLLDNLNVYKRDYMIYSDDDEDHHSVEKPDCCFRALYHSPGMQSVS